MPTYQYIANFIYKGEFAMALSQETLDQIVSNLSPEDRKLLFKQLGLQIEKDKDTPNPNPNPQPTRPKKSKPTVKPNGSIYCCVYCGSARIKTHGFTSAGNQRYICKDCGKSFTENHGSALRYSHIDKETWLTILRGLVNNHSIPVIARDTGLVQSTVWLCKQKVCNAIKEMYGYSDLFNGVSQADEYHCRAAFKGKKDAEFFIYTLRRMPRHHRNRQQKIEYLQKNGLYDKLLAEEPEYLEELLSDHETMMLYHKS